jgi:hypothetical protein
MFSFPVSKIVSTLQTALIPIILISGMGLLLLTMTNRLGRAIDRIRSLSSADHAARPDVRAQITILVTRAKLLRSAIMCAVSSALCAAFLVIFLFVSMLFGQTFNGIIAGLFIVCMAALIGSLVYFMRDVNLSLEALQEKLKG